MVLLQAGDVPLPADLEGRSRPQVQQCQRQSRDFLPILDHSRYFQDLNLELQTDSPSLSTSFFYSRNIYTPLVFLGVSRSLVGIYDPPAHAHAQQ